jgi:hypothetical protein
MKSVPSHVKSAGCVHLAAYVHTLSRPQGEVSLFIFLSLPPVPFLYSTFNQKNGVFQL